MADGIEKEKKRTTSRIEREKSQEEEEKKPTERAMHTDRVYIYIYG
jgi:hypothetical protein